MSNPAGLPPDLNPNLPAGIPSAVVRFQFEVVASPENGHVTTQYTVTASPQTEVVEVEYEVRADVIDAQLPGLVGGGDAGLVQPPGGGPQIAAQVIAPFQVLMGDVPVPADCIKLPIRVSLVAGEVAAWSLGWAPDEFGALPMGNPWDVQGPVPAAPVKIRARLGIPGGWQIFDLVTGGLSTETLIDPITGDATSSGLGPMALLVDNVVSFHLTFGHGERTDAIIRDLAELAGWDPLKIQLPQGNIREKEILVDGPPLPMMSELARMEGGELFVDGEGCLTIVPILPPLLDETALFVPLEFVLGGSASYEVADGPTKIELSTTIQTLAAECDRISTEIPQESFLLEATNPRAQFRLDNDGTWDPVVGDFTADDLPATRLLERVTTIQVTECGETIFESQLIERRIALRAWHFLTNPGGNQRAGWNAGAGGALPNTYAFDSGIDTENMDQDVETFEQIRATDQPVYLKETTHEFNPDGWRTGTTVEIFYVVYRIGQTRRLAIKEGPLTGNDTWDTRPLRSSVQYASLPLRRAGSEVFNGLDGNRTPEVREVTEYQLIPATTDPAAPEEGAFIERQITVTSAYSVLPGGTFFHGPGDDQQGSLGDDLQGVGPSSEDASVFRPVARMETSYKPVGDPLVPGSAQDRTHAVSTTESNLTSGKGGEQRSFRGSGYLPIPARLMPLELATPTIQPMTVSCEVPVSPGRAERVARREAPLAEDEAELTSRCLQELLLGRPVTVTFRTMLAPSLNPAQILTFKFPDPWPLMFLKVKQVDFVHDERGQTQEFLCFARFPE